MSNGNRLKNGYFTYIEAVRQAKECSKQYPNILFIVAELQFNNTKEYVCDIPKKIFEIQYLGRNVKVSKLLYFLNRKIVGYPKLDIPFGKYAYKIREELALGLREFHLKHTY